MTSELSFALGMESVQLIPVIYIELYMYINKYIYIIYHLSDHTTTLFLNLVVFLVRSVCGLFHEVANKVMAIYSPPLYNKGEDSIRAQMWNDHL